ncbi:MAG: transporter [Nocardia sp.]|nr:transporter [Nocardia sp.]
MGVAASVRTSARVVVAAAAAVLAVSCSNDAGGSAVTVGAGDSAQSRLIAEMYAQALSRAGVHAVTKSLGQRSDYLAALDAGALTMVGDTSGDLLRAFDSSSTAALPDKDAATELAAQTTSEPAPATTAPTRSVAGDLSRAVPEGLAVSDIADGTDLRPQLVLSAAAAGRYAKSLTDLAPHCAELSVGIATGHELDPLRVSPDPGRDVLTPLRSTYGCAITRHTEFASDSQLRAALNQGRVDAGVFTSAAALLPGGAGDLVPVTDPKYAFRAQNVIPLSRQGSLDRRELKALNGVAGELTTAELTTLVRRVRDDHAPVGELARTWLDEHNL